ncbi:MAG: mechanosensitive ion channel [Leptolyngbyaceae cyanobacterium bins.349]|nr:mechanosensitive ion channel [Leptolyngbyaceae cyanobacterium bins.349]
MNNQVMELSQYWTEISHHPISGKLVKLVTTTFLDLGGIKISLGFIANLAIQSVLVLAIATVIKRITKNRILTRFGLDLGTREALASIINYIILLAGFFIVLQNVGIKLETLAVVLGAISFVLSFGLQNLASDLASGVTLLLEQPIKVGDYVQLEEATGVVENVAIRSTVIRTALGKAIMIPNTTITSKNVTNWSYQSEECGTEITLRIPRGYDPLVIMDVLQSVVRKEPRVLASPAPRVYLKGIDDDYLNFEIWVWINQPIAVDAIRSALYFLIEAELQTQGFTHRSGEQSAIAASMPTHAMLGELLRKVSYFEHLDNIELRHIIEEGYRQTLNANEIICRENDPGESFYIILSGSVDVYVESIDKHVAVRQTGEFIGEMSLLMGTPRTATLKTLEETTLFVVDRSNLQSLLQKQQGLADKISEELAQRQETLEKLGIKLDGTNKESPFLQIRQRIQSIFGI